MIGPLARRAGQLVAVLLLGLPVVQAQVEVSYTDRFALAWWDVDSEGDRDGSFWAPQIPGGRNTFAFGHAGVAGHGQPGGMVVGKALDGSAFRHPTGFTQVWNDAGSGADLNGAIWNPIPPAGYRSLGMVGTSAGSGAPPVPALASVVCVRSDLVVPGTVGDFIWNDEGTDADRHFSAWKIVPPPGAIDLGTFVASASRAKPVGPVYCLKAGAVAAPPEPSAATIGQLIAAHGPIVRFHPNEQFLTDDPAVILDHPDTRLKWSSVLNPNSFSGFSETVLGQAPVSRNTILDDVQAALAHPRAGDADFKYYLDFPLAPRGGNLARSKAYVRVQPYRGGALTELQFWLFYPWNGPGKANAGCGSLPDVDFNPTGNVGQHFSDWENIRIRVTNKNVWNPGNYSLVNVVVSRHSFEEERPASAVEVLQGSPVIYAAKDSHAHYFSAGKHDYARPASRNLGLCTAYVDLYDLTGNGPELRTYQSAKHLIVSSAWPGTPTTTPDWFFFGGMWGGYERQQFCVNAFGAELHCESTVDNGKPGMLRRSEWAVDCPRNANLGSLRTSAGVPSPAFSPQGTDYAMSVATGVNELVLTAQAADHAAIVELRINGGAFATLGAGKLLGKQSNPLPLEIGANTVEIRVTTPPVPGCPATTRTYTVTVTRAAPPDDNYEENDTRETAFDLTGNGGRWLSELAGMGIQRDEDWYEILVTPDAEEVQVQCSFQHAEGDIDLALHDSAGVEIARSESTSDDEEINHSVPGPGTYYLRIYYDDAGNNYDLRWDAIAPPDTDGDGLIDRVETNTGILVGPDDTGSDPNNPDSDGDGINDGDEVNGTGGFATDPNLADTDGDGFGDARELAQGSDPTDRNSVPSGPRILFIGGQAGPTQGADAAVMAYLEDRYGVQNVTYQAAGATAAGDEAAYDVLIISSTPGSGDMRDKFHNSTIPVLNWEEAIADSGAGEYGMSSVQMTKSLSMTRMNLADHPITAGLPATIDFVTGGETTNTTELFPGLTAVATAGNGTGSAGPGNGLNITGNPTVFIAESGDAVNPGAGIIGTVAPARRVMFAITDNTFNALTDEGRTLFAQALDWLLGISVAVETIEIASVQYFAGNPVRLRVDWGSQPGATYLLEGSEDLLTWTLLGGPQLSGGPTTTLEVDLPDPEPATYFVRVRSSPAAGPIHFVDFNADDGGYVAALFDPLGALTPGGPWIYGPSGVEGSNAWSAAGAEGGSPFEQRLTSPEIQIPATGEVTLSFDHAYNFESGWDGGVVEISVNGAPFSIVTNFTENGYTQALQTDDDYGYAGDLNGVMVFNGDSGGFLHTTANLGTLSAGDLLRVRFRGMWDWATLNLPPAWTVDNIGVTQP